MHLHRTNSTLCVLLLLSLVPGLTASDQRPNIFLFVGEDMGPELGCYGDPLAKTPHLDKLCSEGMRFNRGYTHAPVCAPSRSGLITGRYPTSIGTHHMRSTLLKPPPLFTQQLQKGCYKVFWPDKTDFNFAIPKDAFSSTAKWYNDVSMLPKDQPFFAYYNVQITHESQVRHTGDVHQKMTRELKAADRQDPKLFKLPPYYPDAPEVRNAFKQYYEMATTADQLFGQVLQKLEGAGLLSNAIIIYIGDHGRGMPRSKRWVYHQGIHVPFFVRWPGQIPAKSVSEELVCFLDLAPTILSITGAEPIPGADGQIIFGPKKDAARTHIFAHRDRMDETYDRIRGVVEKDWLYVCNFHPELPYSQVIKYNEENPTMRVWREYHKAGKLNPVQAAFFSPTKPKEELYDLRVDRHCIENLVTKPEHTEKLGELRQILTKWITRTKDLGEIPEKELIEKGLVADRLKEYDLRK